MKVYNTRKGLLVEYEGAVRHLGGLDMNDLFMSANPVARLRRSLAASRAWRGPIPRPLAPVASQEVWASGVTYQRSRSARIEESESSDGGGFYDRVYAAKRPELFFKSPGWRTVGPGGSVRIRADSAWNVPEPEVALALNAHGEIFGWTVANDMSSRSIEGENPLYLPQAKVYDGALALGPCLLVGEPPGPMTDIILVVRRADRVVFRGATAVGQMKRTFPELAGWLTRELTFPVGAYLLTGTGIVPPTKFSLRAGDRISIQIDQVGVLQNTVAV